ncbi:MAG: heavy-metal-associated domain-containing protein [Oscillospiraceae bacterium]
MKRKITIDGMMCEHCAGHVKEALKNLGADDIEVSLEGGYAVCDTEKNDDDIKSAVEEEGYDVISIE